MPKASLPAAITKYLWDVDLAHLDQVISAPAVIERILEYGDLAGIKALQKLYSQEQIIATLKNSRRLSAKAATLFAHFYQVDSRDIVALQAPFLDKQKRF
jgi:hypothetical protein